MAHCDLCEAVSLVLDGTLHRFDEGLRQQLTAQAGVGIDLQGMAEQLDAQRTHILAQVAIWWVAQSMALFKGDVHALENCLANAFAANGYTIYEPTVKVPKPL